MKFTISGDSHGNDIIGIMEGLPAGLKINIETINYALNKRKRHYGRGQRAHFEQDNAEINSGLWKGVTTGAPITVRIKNNANNTEKNLRTVPRPGHGDYSAYSKYGLEDLNIYTERNSARWTCALTALGNISKQYLNFFGIRTLAFTYSVGHLNLFSYSNDFDLITKERDESIVFCPDEGMTLRMIEIINRAFHEGDTLGGRVKVIVNNLKPGIGGYSSLFEKLESRISQTLMIIPSMKGIIFGNTDFSNKGSQYHDPFYLDNYGNICRSTNNAGGIEAGLTNGQNIESTLYFKPIPTLRKPLDSVDLKTKTIVKAPYIRSDVTVVPSAAIIAENAICIPIMEAICERFGNDNIEEIKKRYDMI
jgi:chorismate synthase